MPKHGLGVDVLTAARKRIGYVFDEFPAVCVSFSGGKDSTVLLHLSAAEARKRNRRISVLFIDWEAQFKLTIAHVGRMFELYADCTDPYWIALPLTTVNAVSAIEPEWTCWDPAKRDLWVRATPAHAISDPAELPCYEHAMTFEEFVPAFTKWIAGGQFLASLVGIRSDESLNRYRTVSNDSKSMYEGRQWTTWMGEGAYSAYPLYDWRTEDVWTYHARYPEHPHNALYDRMHRAGLSVHQMRICEPYGNEQRRGLWLYHVIEPETWGRVAARVAGANSGALYAGEPGNVLGNRTVSLPAGHTWESFAHYLLDTMPHPTAEHYRAKIARYLHYCMSNYGDSYAQGIPDAVDGDTGSEDVPSWRRICKVILRNDYWCQGLSFSPTKAGAYDRYRKVMKERRKRWGLI